eukprot:CAMPEP_0176462284 /NCGR_PEP_ID=MMETSP0127-20121128/35167_1 /TAXON_ID=938130 /ORGANISM="Platyophrya macrostoma, Strain WH" /LENGTH=48 /DNA_ID= /DNA_START= /DNA_END= /DNA_ORIENTATION=
MDIEREGISNEMVIQGGSISYEDAYELNGQSLIDTQSLIEILSLILDA